MTEMTDAEVFGNTAQNPPVPVTSITPPSSGMVELSDADVFGSAQGVSPSASASASPSKELSDAQVFGGGAASPHWAATRGLVSGFAQDYPQLAGETLEGLSH